MGVGSISLLTGASSMGTMIEGRRYWGRSGSPMGTVIVGTIGTRSWKGGALIGMQTGGGMRATIPRGTHMALGFKLLLIWTSIKAIFLKAVKVAKEFLLILMGPNIMGTLWKIKDMAMELVW
eukprot:CAMPEP_0201285004 /NCGR_PEP_ID=MMETSP1317-20130820/91701_1 /ASSEMBLY_ACC=CAM_ASM_000770 /TAXON_ID=187299 /ORGANISM="Undescribed Undescribed, Strain Undescribed" /LENGTH=121 /DNA_ID=CAMNT_0047607629 /DNA_START=45 /DNA_END=407 /DNA_ORIENTATION=-